MQTDATCPGILRHLSWSCRLQSPTLPASKDSHAWNLKQIDQFLENNAWIPPVYRYASIQSPDKNGAQFRCVPLNGDDTGIALALVTDYERAFAVALKSLKTTRIDAIDEE